MIINGIRLLLVLFLTSCLIHSDDKYGFIIINPKFDNSGEAKIIKSDSPHFEELIEMLTEDLELLEDDYCGISSEIILGGGSSENIRFYLNGEYRLSNMTGQCLQAPQVSEFLRNHMAEFQSVRKCNMRFSQKSDAKDFLEFSKVNLYLSGSSNIDGYKWSNYTYHYSIEGYLGEGVMALDAVEVDSLIGSLFDSNFEIANYSSRNGIINATVFSNNKAKAQDKFRIDRIQYPYGIDLIILNETAFEGYLSKLDSSLYQSAPPSNRDSDEN